MKPHRPCTAGPGGWSGRRGGDVAVEGRQCWSEGTPSREHTSELHLFPSSKSWWAGIPVPGSCWLPLLLDMHTHSHPYATHSDTSPNKHKQGCTEHTRTHTHTHYSCNWKLCSGGGMSEDVRSDFSTRSILLSPLTQWPWGQPHRPWLHPGGSVQPLDRQRNKPSPFDAALPWCSMPIHPKERGWDYSKATRETLFVFLLWRKRFHSHL